MGEHLSLEVILSVRFSRFLDFVKIHHLNDTESIPPDQMNQIQSCPCPSWYYRNPTEWNFGDHHELICFRRAAGKFGIERNRAEGFES